MRLIDADAYEQAISKMMSSYGGGNYSNDYEKMIADEMIADCIYTLREMPTLYHKYLEPPGWWISTEDRLPKLEQPVLICLNLSGGYIVCEAQLNTSYDESGFMWQVGDNFYNVDEASHWISLPLFPGEVL